MPTAVGYGLALPAALADSPVTVSTGRASVGWALRGAGGGKGNPAGDTLTYPGTLGGVDVRYTVTGDAVKEDLLLADASAASSATFDLAVSGLTVRPAADGGIDLVAADGSVAMRFTSPTVVDAAGATGPVGYRLGGSPAAPTVTVTVDPGWLADPARVFPVDVDPTTAGLAPTAVTYLSAASPDVDHSGTPTLRAGVDDRGLAKRVLAKFDVTGSIPANVTLLGTSVNSDVISGVSPAGAGVTVQTLPVDRAWTAAATWNSYDGVHRWATAGGDTSGAPVGTGTIDAADGVFYLPDSPLVHGWYDGTIPNNGLMIRESPGAGYGMVEWPNAGSFFLAVNWAARTGLAGNYRYDTVGFSDRVTASVNLANGNLVLDNTDVTIAGTGLNLTVTRDYNSLGTPAVPSSSLPTGWTETPGYDLRLNDYTDGQLLNGPSGSAAWFAGTFDSGFTSPPGIDADLTTDGVLTYHKTGLAYHFGYFGQLDSITDRNGNTITVSWPSPRAWDSRPTSITDTQGRMLTFSYSNGRLSGLTDSTGRHWGYGYDPTSGYLTSYTDPAGHLTRYGYDPGSGLLVDVVDDTTPTPHHLTVGYDSAGRVTRLTQVTTPSTGAGPTSTFGYTAGPVTYTDPGSGQTFSYAGKTVVSDPDGHSSSYYRDTASQVVRAVDPLGHTRTTGYTPNSTVASVTAASGATSINSYDPLGNLTRVQAPDTTGGGVGSGRSSTLTYPAPVPGGGIQPGSSYQPTGRTDPQGNTTSYSYTTSGNLAAATPPAGSGGVAARNSYQGDPDGSGGTVGCGGKPGQLCTTTDGNGHPTGYGYDPAGNLTTIIPPGPLGATRITVDALSRPVTVSDGRGITTSYGYDKLDRVTQVLTGGATGCAPGAGSCVGYGFDPAGNRTSRIDITGTTTIGYDPLNRPVSQTLPGGAVSSLVYDPAGNITGFTDPNGTVGYGYDTANRLTSVTEPGGSCGSTPVKCTRFGYDVDDHPDQRHLPERGQRDLGL